MGTITHSNLCTEIVQFSSPTETAVCNLASIVLSKFVAADRRRFDYSGLHRAVEILVYNLNRVIDNNKYPLQGSSVSNMAHRSVGIGVQGLADTFTVLRLPFDSVPARLLNERIAQTIYHAAIEASCDLVPVFGRYPSFQGSPASQGIFQFDLWGVDPTNVYYDWHSLKLKVVQHGLANSLLVAMMPTAGTSQIMGCTESFEPVVRLVYLINFYLLSL